MKMKEKIILIDDDPIINFVHSRIIQHKFPESQILIFNNGSSALEFIQKSLTVSYLIFLDLNMPVMNGWEFLEAVAKEESSNNLQIHILTSSIDPQDFKKAKKNRHVRSYFTKPLKVEDIENLS